MSPPERPGTARLSAACNNTADVLEDGLGSVDPATATALRIAVWANRIAAGRLAGEVSDSQVTHATRLMDSHQAALAHSADQGAELA